MQIEWELDGVEYRPRIVPDNDEQAPCSGMEELSVIEFCEVHEELRRGRWDRRLGKKPMGWGLLFGIYYPLWLSRIDRRIGWMVAQKWNWDRILEKGEGRLLKEWLNQ